MGTKKEKLSFLTTSANILIWLAIIAKNVHSVLAKLATFTALWKASPIVIITLYWGHLVQSLTHFTSPVKVPRAPGFQVGQTPGLQIPWWGHHCHQTATVLERINCVLEKAYDLFDITAAFTVRYKFKSVAGTLCSQIAPRLLLSIRPSQRRCRRFQPVAHFYQQILINGSIFLHILDIPCLVRIWKLVWSPSNGFLGEPYWEGNCCQAEEYHWKRYGVLEW